MLLLLLSLNAPAADWSCQARGTWEDCQLRNGVESCSTRTVTGNATHPEQGSAHVRAMDACDRQVQQQVLSAAGRTGSADLLYTARYGAGCEVASCSGPSGAVTPGVLPVAEPYTPAPPVELPPGMQMAADIPACQPMVRWICGECGEGSASCQKLRSSPIDPATCTETWVKLSHLLEKIDPEVLRPKLCRMFE